MNAVNVLGKTVDDQTRCEHYASELDIVAIRFACCGDYYPCHLCHAECADHPATRWPREQHSRRAVLCGVCRTELSIAEYFSVDSCPECGGAFNPGCRLHLHHYFED
jgi:uncharacterized CHY-type Zn-finger protein